MPVNPEGGQDRADSAVALNDAPMAEAVTQEPAYDGGREARACRSGVELSAGSAAANGEGNSAPSGAELGDIVVVARYPDVVRTDTIYHDLSSV